MPVGLVMSYTAANCRCCCAAAALCVSHLLRVREALPSIAGCSAAPLSKVPESKVCVSGAEVRLDAAAAEGSAKALSCCCPASAVLAVVPDCCCSGDSCCCSCCCGSCVGRSIMASTSRSSTSEGAILPAPARPLRADPSTAALQPPSNPSAAAAAAAARAASRRACSRCRAVDVLPRLRPGPAAAADVSLRRAERTTTGSTKHGSRCWGPWGPIAAIAADGSRRRLLLVGADCGLVAVEGAGRGASTRLPKATTTAFGCAAAAAAGDLLGDIPAGRVASAGCCCFPCCPGLTPPPPAAAADALPGDLPAAALVGVPAATLLGLLDAGPAAPAAPAAAAGPSVPPRTSSAKLTAAVRPVPAARPLPAGPPAAAAAVAASLQATSASTAAENLLRSCQQSSC